MLVFETFICGQTWNTKTVNAYNLACYCSDLTSRDNTHGSHSTKHCINTLRTGDANLRLLRFCITTVKDR
jgi:hypothetical protein